jgi:hypothetical protein
MEIEKRYEHDPRRKSAKRQVRVLKRRITSAQIPEVKIGDFTYDTSQAVHDFTRTIAEVRRSPTYWEESRPGKCCLEDLCRNESHDAQRLRRNKNMTSTADAHVFEVEIVGQVGIIRVPA